MFLEQFCNNTITKISFDDKFLYLVFFTVSQNVREVCCPSIRLCKHTFCPKYKKPFCWLIKVAAVSSVPLPTGQHCRLSLGKDAILLGMRIGP
ncbi:MAG: hypothetical protein CM15mV135_300 [uncultured marine virus]|nr:MAG: hypothetical protein CM15mV135_300 [uncultured marine virus]